ncbi:PAS domain S-box protein, partial [Ferruginibacter sp.]
LRTLLEEVLPQKTSITDYEVTHNFSSIGIRTILLSALEITREKKEEKLILLSIEDITERKEAAKKIEASEKLQAFLLKLSDALRPLNNSVDIEEAATKIAMDFMDVDRCFYANIEDGNAIILRDSMRGDLPSNAGIYPLSSFTLLKAALDTGSTYIVNDVNTSNIIDEDLKQICIQLQNHSFINIPVIKNRKSVGIFCLVQNKPREWTNAEVQLAKETAERTWAAIERAKAEEALCKSEEKYRSLFNSIDQGFVLAELIRNKEGKGIDYYVHEVNSNYEKQTGINIEMVLGKSILQSFPTIDTWWIETYAAVVDNQLPVRFEKFFEFTNRWFEIKAIPNGKEMFIILFTDITERKQAQKLLEENEHRYHMMLMNSPFAFSIMKGKDMVVTLANDLMKNFWGKGDEVEGKTLLQVLPELIDQPFPAMLDKVYTSGEPVNANEILARLNRNGVVEERYFNIVYQPHFETDKTISGVITIAHEVTNQVLGRKQIEDSNKRYNMMLLQSPFAFAILKGIDMVVTLANDSVKEMWGKGKDVEGKSIFEVIPEIKDQGFPELLNEVYSTGISYSSNESLVQLQRNGKMEEAYFNFAYQPYREADETISGVVIIATEVTPMAILNKKIKESEAFNRTVLESSPDCVKMLDEEGRLQFMNTNGICLLELDNFEQVQNTYWWDMWEPHNRQIIKDAVATAQSGEKIQLQLFGPTAKGTPKWWDIIVLPVQEDGTDKNLHRILSVSRDITEQKQNELKEKELLTRFQNLVLQAPVAICVLRGPNYIIEVINKGMYEMWDRTLEQALNKPAFEVLPELMEQGFKELLDTVYKTGERFVAEELAINLKRNGNIENAFVKFVYEPLKDANGNIAGVMALAHEITEQVLSRKKIEESEIQFRQMAELIPQKIWTSDAEGNKDYFNNTFLNYVGKTTEELKGNGWQKVMHPDDWVKNKIQWEQCLLSGQNFVSENRLLRKDGQYLWHLTQAVALKDELGNIKMWVGSKTEIQEHKQHNAALEKSVELRTRELEQSNKELEQKNKELFIAREEILTEYSRSLIEASLDPLITINAEGKITDMNQATVTITGFTREELSNSNFFKYFTEPKKAREVYQMVFTNGNIINSPLTLRHVNGKLTDVFLNGSVYKDQNNEVVGVVVVARDVTEEKKIAQALTEAKVFAETATLAAEKEKQKAIEATQIAEAAVIAKQQFLSNMSHEIRTPMNAIIGFTKVILKTNLSAQQTEYLQAINLSGHALIVLINDILDLAKVDAGKIVFEQIPFKLSNTFTAILHLFENRVEEKNLKFIKEYDATIPTVLLGDPVRLHQIILNLISNAVKFTSKGSISISVRMLMQNETEVELEFIVADTGIGIPADKMEAVFENFHQASSETSRIYGGTGLGLAIV